MADLLVATRDGQLDVVQCLLASRADPNKPADPEREGPLHLAARYGRPEAARVLLAAGANVAALNVRSSTPLHVAAANGNDDVARLLLQAGANVDAVSVGNNGKTPLHLATVNGYSSTPRLLLQEGADPTILDDTGRSAADYARERATDEVVSLIQRHEEEWTRPFILQLTCEDVEGEAAITCRTLGGNVAAAFQWTWEDPIHKLPSAVLEAVKSSGFRCPFEPLRVSNLRLVKPDGELLNICSDATSLASQMGI